MRSHHGTISLVPLDRSQVRDAVTELSARHALPREVVDNVAARRKNARSPCPAGATLICDYLKAFNNRRFWRYGQGKSKIP